MKRTFAVAALVATFVLGLGGAALATHTSQIEEHIVPWALVVGTNVATGEITITDTDALPHETITETTTATITVTESTPTTTATETEPAPAGDCSTANYLDWGPIYDEGDCRIGTTIIRTNALWFCDRPLASYGPLPIRVVQTWSIAAAVGQNGIELRSGCSGDGTAAIDLIVVQSLLGVGRISDPFKTRMSPGPQDVDVTGILNASGPDAVPGAGDHQDCIQLQGGKGTDLVNMDGCGDYAAGISNTQAAGGTVFYSLNDSQANVYGGEYIGCNHSLYPDPREIGPGMRASHVVNAKFRSGNNTTPWCSNFNTSNPCAGAISELAEFTNVTCQRFLNGRWTDVAPG